MTGQKAVDTSRNRGSYLCTSGSTLLYGWQNTGAGCPQRLCNLHLWRGCAISISGGIQKPSGHSPGQPAPSCSAQTRGLDQMTFLPQPLHDCVKVDPGWPRAAELCYIIILSYPCFSLWVLCLRAWMFAYKEKDMSGSHCWCSVIKEKSLSGMEGGNTRVSVSPSIISCVFRSYYLSRCPVCSIS